ncbi:MAG TPA: 3-hydroxyacyl-CoA dehydrogenase family protein [Puia sp.]
MILAVLASDPIKEEMAVSPFFQSHEVIHSENISLWVHHAADVFIDLSFEPEPEKIKFYAKLLPRPVLVNAVTETLDRIHPEFIRINGWPGFLKGNCLEAAAGAAMQEKARGLFGEQMIFVPDQPGLVSARIVAMIINEAFFTWEAGTASKEDIDIAMKLGTGYPYGPFEWAHLIGVDKISELMQRLSEENPLYELAQSLRRKA